jgi:hypothetical protein
VTKRAPVQWFPSELAWIEANHHLPRAELHHLFVRRFDRPDVSQANLTALCKRRGWLTGRTGCFPKGNVPANAGRKGYVAPGSEKGWFKAGRAPQDSARWQPIGTEILRYDGYVWRKVRDDGPLHHRWRQVHLIRWEAAHGLVPDGHVLKCLDGDRTNTDPDNWAAVPRAILPRLAGGRWHRPYDDAPAELKPTLLAIAKLEHAARERRRAKQESAA